MDAGQSREAEIQKLKVQREVEIPKGGTGWEKAGNLNWLSARLG